MVCIFGPSLGGNGAHKYELKIIEAVTGAVHALETIKGKYPKLLFERVLLHGRGGNTSGAIEIKKLEPLKC